MAKTKTQTNTTLTDSSVGYLLTYPKRSSKDILKSNSVNLKFGKSEYQT